MASSQGMASSPRMRGYVLAGGRSSRMGADKAEVMFDGRTMLATAVATMQSVCDEVAVVGAREHVPPPPASCVVDRFPGCGPMGGIEAALADCGEHGGEFAVFLPVDTPLLPGGLLRALAEQWTRSPTVRVALTVADGRVQPLISMLHVSLQPALRRALERGDAKLQPMLGMAAAEIAERMGMAEDAVRLATVIAFGEDRSVMAGESKLDWTPTEQEWGCRSSWFANLNTPLELQAARDAVAAVRAAEDKQGRCQEREAGGRSRASQ